MHLRALALGSLALLGCGARTALHDPEPALADGAVVSASPCARLAQTFCARLQLCAPSALSNGLTGGRAVGADRCVSRVTLACEGWNATPDLSAPPARIEACRAEVVAASCGEVGWRFFTDGPLCDAWPRGARALGAACRFGAQCASGQCTYRLDRGCGVCATAAPAPTQRPGEACDARRRCQYWQRCAGGLCLDRLGEGGGCSGDDECDAAQGLACDRAGRRCIRRPVSPAGGACLSSVLSNPREPASAMCEEDHVCFNRNDFGQGQCRPLLDDGAACLSYDPACAYPARCQGGRCVIPAGIVCAP